MSFHVVAEIRKKQNFLLGVPEVGVCFDLIHQTQQVNVVFLIQNELKEVFQKELGVGVFVRAFIRYHEVGLVVFLKRFYFVFQKLLLQMFSF